MAWVPVCAVLSIERHPHGEVLVAAQLEAAPPPWRTGAGERAWSATAIGAARPCSRSQPLGRAWVQGKGWQKAKTSEVGRTSSTESLGGLGLSSLGCQTQAPPLSPPRAEGMCSASRCWPAGGRLKRPCTPAPARPTLTSCCRESNSRPGEPVDTLRQLSANTVCSISSMRKGRLGAVNVKSGAGRR
jgi:hypothetical protein